MTEEDNESNDEIIYKILIVDDEKEVLNALQMTLEYAKQFKSEITCFSNPNKVLKVLQNNDYDLVLSDYKMGKINGIDLLKKIKDKYPDIVRILITGISDIEVVKDAINKADVDFFIEKPWDNKQLRSIIHNALKNRKEKNQNDVQLANISKTKHNIIDWLMAIYSDAENMGLDLNEVNYYIEIAMTALDDNDWQKALTNINKSVNIMMKLAENSYPELSIKKIDNLQLESGKWNKYTLEISNNGDINAKDIKLDFIGEFEIKGTKKVPIIELNETKKVPIEIFAEKRGIFPLNIILSYKKMFDEKEFKTEDSFWIQVGDISGKAKLKRKFGYHKGYIKMELNIINEDLSEIKDVNLDLIYDDKILVLSYMKPILNKLRQKFQVGSINSRDGKNITFYFDPLLCTDTFIGGGVSFIDSEDNEKYIMLTPQKVKILCPSLKANTGISLADLKSLLENELSFRGEKILNIPLGLNVNDAFMICKKLIFRYNTKIIHEVTESNPFIGEAWFFCITDDSKSKFVIKISIDENTNCIELSIAGSNNAALTGLLTDVLNSLNIELQNNGIILQPIRQIDNLILKESLLASKRDLIENELHNLDQILETDLAQKIMEDSKIIAKKFETIARHENIHL
ncbi:MAG: response regulator, partial [Candidatus Thorarchaeota archaeon]